MTERKWTPGPWEIGNDNRIEDGGYGVAVIVDDCPNHEASANAHLIAAAPDMYEALKTARDYVFDASNGGLVWSDGHNDPLVEMATGDLTRIDAALAKARGE